MLAILAFVCFLLGGFKAQPIGDFSWLYLGLALFALSHVFDTYLLGRFRGQAA